MTSHAAVYRAAQARVMGLVNNQNAGSPVPARPEWTVRDVVAHLAGALTDVRAGRVEDATSDAGVAAQIERRRDLSLAEIVAEWHLGTQAGAWTLAGDFGPLLATDLVCHEFDIRGALGNRDCRRFDAVRAAASFFLPALDRVLREDGMPALLLRVDGEEIVVGDGVPQGRVTLSWFGLLRTLSGRRSPGQVRALPWEGDPDIWLASLCLLGPAGTALQE